MTPPPRVSVVTSVYNEMPWLPVSIESVLSQTFTDFEFLLIDDGSKNGCPEALTGYEARDPRVRVIRKENGGQVSGLNRGIAEAQGTYIARLDADDMMYPTRLEKQVAYLDAHPEVALVGSQFDLAWPQGTTRSAVPTNTHLTRWTLLFENCFMGGGALFRRDAVRALGGYDAAFEYSEDYDLWERIADEHDAVNLPEILSWFNNLRTTNGSTLNSERQELRCLAVSERGIRRYAPGASDEVISDVYNLVPWHQLPDAETLAREWTRAAAAAQLLIQVHDAFLKRWTVTTESRRAIRADLERRLMAVRFSLVADGGIGQLARLHRPRWDRRARLLSLPSLLARP